MSNEPTEDQITEIGAMVAEIALAIFEDCGAESDFCVQAIGTNVVFGGTNRLIWNPSRGFRPDRRYCTAEFLNRYDALCMG